MDKKMVIHAVKGYKKMRWMTILPATERMNLTGKKKKAKVTKPQNVNTVRFNIPDDHKQARLNSGNNRSE